MANSYEIIKFSGETVIINQDQQERMMPVLLETGKFIKVGEQIINISEIKQVSPKKSFKSYVV